MQHPLRSSNIGMRRCCNTDHGRWRCVGWEMLDGACGPPKSSLLAALYASTQAPADLVLVGDEGIWGDSCLVINCNSCCSWSGSSSFTVFVFCILLELDLAWRPSWRAEGSTTIYICLYKWNLGNSLASDSESISNQSQLYFPSILGKTISMMQLCWRHGLQPPPAQHITHIWSYMYRFDQFWSDHASPTLSFNTWENWKNLSFFFFRRGVLMRLQITPRP